MSRLHLIYLISLIIWRNGVEKEVTTGVSVSLSITDVQSVTIGILNAGKMCFDDIHSTNFRIDRHTQSSTSKMWWYSSSNEDINDTFTRNCASREHRQDAEIKEEYYG